TLPGIVRRAVRPGQDSSDNTRMAHAATTQMECAFAPPAAVEADVLLLPWFEDDAPSAVPGLDAATGGELTRALDAKEFTGRLYDLFVAPVVDREWRVRRVLFVGAGPSAKYGSDLARRLASTGGLSMKARRVARAAFLV